MSETLVARWESKSGKHYVDLFQYPDGSCSYMSRGSGGNLGKLTLDEAITEMEMRVEQGYYQPDANKTPMHRVEVEPQS